MKTRIVLLHGTPVAVEPIQRAFASRWPEAETVNLLDDSLSVDRAKDRDLTPRMFERFLELGSYAHRIGANAVLVTCSAFGPAIERMARELPVPVLKPNEAMFREAIGKGRRIGMLATFAPSLPTMTEEFEEFVRETGAQATLRTIVVDGAMEALRRGDAGRHNQLVAARAPELADCDAIMLAHFSTSRAAAEVSAAIRTPVLTAPDAAVDLLKSVVSGKSPGASIRSRGI
ncbi:MAG: aspartate/glutamate racemase family protein [Hyphomicrobiaceae bacterium]|nr:aspartate/glutamate racemase family protein [Hyphomicrobiaceae bacterium]